MSSKKGLASRPTETDMIRNGEVSRARAEEIATMVMRTNAGKLYKLGLK